LLKLSIDSLRATRFRLAGVVRLVSQITMRVGAIDVGSNALRLAIGEVRATGVTAIHTERAFVRLGAEAFSGRAFSADTIERSVAAFALFLARMREFGVERYRAVATSAMRESRSREALVAAIAMATGLVVEVIEGPEEARLARGAVLDQLPSSHAFLADLGGGSTEVSIVAEGAVVAAASLPVGTVRFLSVAADLVERAVEEQLNGFPFERLASHAPFWGTGGSFDVLAQFCPSNAPKTMDVARLKSWQHEVAALSTEQRCERLGIRPDRADVLVPAAVIVATLAKKAGRREVYAPGVGLKDGLLADFRRDAGSIGRSL
jgi:exopolyphosphatase/guanosine-5'-triphosphate,3'-diphosphate pyrophosphatase